MDELYFLGMDIIEETKNFMKLSQLLCTDGMTESELKAYQMGIENVLSALSAMIEESDLPVLNINGLEIQTELSIEDVERYYID